MRTGSFVNALVKGQRGAEARMFSLAASLPVVTMDAGRAARRIVRALERGERFVTVGVPWKAVRLLSALAPNLTGELMSLVSRLLPGPGADRPERPPDPVWRHRGGPTAATSLGDAAAERNNEGPIYRH
jgi:hypothetical protein